MIKNIMFIILKMFNVNPIVHISIDENFDTIIPSLVTRKNTFRLSLVALNAGTIKIYIITFLFSPQTFKFSELNFIKALHFDKVQHRKTDIELQAMTDTYEVQTLQKINNDDKAMQEEFLKIRISENNDSLSNIFDKLNYYTTIILAFSAALIYAYSKLIEFQLNITTYLIYYIAFINLLDLLDLILLLRRSVSISGFIRSSFKDLRKSKTTYALTKSLYFDWAASTDDVKYYAGLTKNTEMRSFRVILLGFFLLISTTIFYNNAENDNSGTLFYLQSYTSLTKQ
ncbi:hypothetical protein [Enterobacter ludwigii]|uniref:hypothetical protein n=1 Tax=Enterobacter ludwigii TaxID=299767 RepID=UPI00397709DE